MHLRFILLSVLALLMVQLQLPAALVVEIGQNFTASTYGLDSPYVPPDSNGTVGPNHFVELINGRFAVFDKSTGLRVQSLSDVAFWNNAGVSFAAGVGISDPRLIYDPSAQRWFAAAIDTATVSNRFLLAVSSSLAPTGTWHGFAFVADPAQGNFADFPTLGLDANGVYLAADLFDAFGNDLSQSVLVAIPKAGLLGATPSITNRTLFNNLSTSSRGSILQPLVSYDTPLPGESVLAVGDLGLDFLQHSNLVSFSVLNASAPGASLTASSVISVPSYTIPINPVQPDGTDTLDDGDARISATVYQVGYVQYAVHAIEVGNRAAVRWYKINATNASLIQSGTITNANLDLFYPSIAANSNGTVVIGCNGCSSNSFVSCYAFLGETSDGLTTFGNPILLKAGLTNYHYLDSASISRWGDYSATSADPSDPTRFWTIQMYPSGPGTWSTQVTELRTVPLQLALRRLAEGVLISWPKATTALELQLNPALGLTNQWTAITQTPFITNGQFAVLVPITNSASFFRLRQL